jgi:serine/threonine protein kinase/tetratricopeptide (TPR) repeat protein
MLNSNTANLRAGDRAGNYQILEMAGAGGMGVVYKALDLKLERTVALKFLPMEVNSSNREKEQFLKEARTASSLDHPNIGVIHGVEETSDGRSFIVMAFYDGESLAQKIRKGPISYREAVDIGIQMAKGLEAAHARNVAHRDVKPGNVLITPGGLVKIVDFGLARTIASASMTQSGGSSGTVGYMSPEQSLGQVIDGRTDIWAMGVVLAEMFTGVNPFSRENVPSMVVAILTDPPRPMKEVPGELQQIVYRALSKDPAHRQQSCAELRRELENVQSKLGPVEAVDNLAPTVSLKAGQLQKYIDHASQSAWGPGAASQNAGWTRKLWIGAGAAVVIALMVLAFPGTRNRLLGVGESSERHIAVLPLDNVGNDPANAPLAEGLMESLAGKLSDLDESGKALWVVPSSEVRQRNISDPTAALRELGATLVVKGSVTRNGRDVRLAVNLIDTKNLRQIGSAHAEDSAGDLVSLQDQVVARLAKLMHVTVSGDLPVSSAASSSNPAAYESYLKALGYLQRYDTPGNLDQAISTLNQAVSTDPQFALGYAELGEAYRLKNLLDPNPQWIEKVSANSNQALKLNDRLPAAYVTLGSVHRNSDKLELALQEYEHALRLEPHNADALMGEASTYEKMGRTADAEETFKKAAAMRPDYWDGYNSLGNFYDRQGKYVEAIAQLQHAAELTPDNAVVEINLAASYLDRGSGADLPAAEQALKKSIALVPSYAAYTNLGLLYLNEKRYSEAVAMTEKALQLNDKDYLVWANLMTAYQGLHQTSKFEEARDHAISLLEQAVKAKPEDALMQVSLAALYAQKGLREKALTRAQAALARSPDNPNVLELAGETYETLGDRHRALECIDRALRNGYPLDQLKGTPELHNLLSDPDFRPVPGKSSS